MTSANCVPSKLLEGTFGAVRIIDLPSVAGDALAQMPWCHRILLENTLRHPDHATFTRARDSLLRWQDTCSSNAEISFWPLRVLMHDTTCGPALVDIAAMRDVLSEAGGDPKLLNPSVPVATSVDHSVAVDSWGASDSLSKNMAREIELNRERYMFMKWASLSLVNFRVFPPGTGIMHTLNMEHLATIVTTEDKGGERWAMPDTMVGTDSHTPMINGLGVLGWGVGGIEAESVMLSTPVSLQIPDVLGVRLTGSLPEGTLATDLALVVTHRLRKVVVPGDFVEFFGPGVGSLSAGQRAVVSNMAPEYGATTAFFPVDERTLMYLGQTGRSDAQVELVEAYCKAQRLWYTPDCCPHYTKTIEIDLSGLTPSIAGPQRPQDLLRPSEVPAAVLAGHRRQAAVTGPEEVPAGAVVIAAIASCTNTTDVELLVTAALVARKARAFGLRPPPWVKTSFTPGSPATAKRLGHERLLEDLEAIGFAIAGYGCGTCIGNSGRLTSLVEDAIERHAVAPVAVLSGNRNFPNRVHGQLESALLVSPPLVVAYALAGHALLDVTADPIGRLSNGRTIHLSDLWPSSAEVRAALESCIRPEDVLSAYTEAEASSAWAALSAPESSLFPWDPSSTYLLRPPFVHLQPDCPRPEKLEAHVLLLLGDDVTTDHISPAGLIPVDSDAGAWLIERGENPFALNVYASRRGNWEVMMRGLFTNRALINLMCPTAKPGSTDSSLTGTTVAVWRAAAEYKAQGLPVVIIAGERYGTGSSRDWAAKGPQLLGVRAVLAKSFERIHRSNLICMGILPLQLPPEWRSTRLHIDSETKIHFIWDPSALSPLGPLKVQLVNSDPTECEEFDTVALLETENEVALIKSGGIIPRILREALSASWTPTSTTESRTVKQ